MQNTTPSQNEQGDLVSYWSEQIEHVMAESQEHIEVDVVHEGLWTSMLEQHRVHEIN